jgi:hypothetical protein
MNRAVDAALARILSVIFNVLRDDAGSKESFITLGQFFLLPFIALTDFGGISADNASSADCVSNCACCIDRMFGGANGRAMMDLVASDAVASSEVVAYYSKVTTQQTLSSQMNTVYGANRMLRHFAKLRTEHATSAHVL